MKRWFAVLCFSLSLAAQAFSGQATDDAFAALLAMPGAAQQRGYWEHIEAPADFSGETENDLIAYLGKTQKAGADFNAYRHFGTLLHHAIRDGQMKTAFWLLAHGADPRKTLKGGADDALALAERYKRNALIKLLRGKYEMTLPEPKKENPPLPDPERLNLAYNTPAEIELARKLVNNFSWQVNSSKAEVAQAQWKKWQGFRAKMPAAAYAVFIFLSD